MQTFQNTLARDIPGFGDVEIKCRYQVDFESDRADVHSVEIVSAKPKAKLMFCRMHALEKAIQAEIPNFRDDLLDLAIEDLIEIRERHDEIRAERAGWH